MKRAKRSKKDRDTLARLFESALLGLGERGHDALDLDWVLARAEVSPAAFAAEFDDLDSCLFAAYDELTGRLLELASARCEPEEEWPLRVRKGLQALLDGLAAEPEMAWVLTRSFPEIGPLAQQRYVEFIESFAPLLRDGRRLSNPGDAHPGEIEMLAIDAAEELICEEIDSGRAADLSSQTSLVLFPLLVPFLGPAEARRWLETLGPAGDL